MKKKLTDKVIKAIEAGVTTSAAAGVMGHKGGSMKTPAQMAAYKRNAKFGGRPELYEYDPKVYCILGVKNQKKCLIPLKVLANPKAYRHQSFTVKWKNPDGIFERYHVFFRYVDFNGTIEVDDRGIIHVQRYPSRVKVGDRSEIVEMRNKLTNRNRKGRPSAPKYVVVDKKQ